MFRRITKLYYKPKTLLKNLVLMSTNCILIIDASNIVTRRNISWLALIMQVMGKRHIYGGAIAGSTITLSNDLKGFFINRNMSFYSEEIKRGYYGEKYVDDFLHKEARKLISKYSNISNKTMIFVTGDGNNNNGKDTFPLVIHDAIRHGFLIEIWSWPNRRSKNLTKLKELYKDKVKINNITKDIIRK